MTFNNHRTSLATPLKYTYVMSLFISISIIMSVYVSIMTFWHKQSIALSLSLYIFYHQTTLYKLAMWL